MRRLLKYLLRGEKHASDRYVYHDLTIEEQMKEWFGRARSNKEMGISIKTTKQQARLTFKEAEMTIEAIHDFPIKQTKMELDKVVKELTDVKERYAEYVESEKKAIPDKEFENIDKLHAKLGYLQSQSEEQEQINSQSNSQNDEGQDQ